LGSAWAVRLEVGDVAGDVQRWILPVSVRSMIGLGIALSVLVACGGDDGDRQVKVAQTRVTQKEKAVTEAKSAATAAATAFCDASRSYITALDRYGDVLRQSAATVGDVKDAGSDLKAPREDVVDAAQAAVDAQHQLATAEQELADAKGALAAAKATPGATSSPSPTAIPSPTPSPTPLAPAATVNRVKQADSEFQSVQSGITDETPLVQASQQFNAAAVALEMSWLRLFSDAGCLTDDQHKQAEAAVRDYTVALQQSLTTAGYYEGKVDGVYGPSTVDAVEALQKAHGLPVTGTVDKATAGALQADLQAKGGAAADQAVASTAAVQQTLKLAGFWTGPVDGTWTPALTEAVKDFQTALGVKPTGTVDAATVAAVENAIANAQQPKPATSTTPSAVTTTSAS
jgi:murein L,D-transpeptidase YcbB/YkuD